MALITFTVLVQTSSASFFVIILEDLLFLQNHFLLFYFYRNWSILWVWGLTGKATIISLWMIIFYLWSIYHCRAFLLFHFLWAFFLFFLNNLAWPFPIFIFKEPIFIAWLILFFVHRILSFNSYSFILRFSFL